MKVTHSFERWNLLADQHGVLYQTVGTVNYATVKLSTLTTQNHSLLASR